MNMKKAKPNSGKWEILSNGDLLNSENQYTIPADRLDETDWIPHLMTKSWMEGKWNEFIPAYVKALELTGNATLSKSFQTQN